MLNNRTATIGEKEYGLRRIIYDTLLAAKAIDFLARPGKDYKKHYSAKEMAKATALLMARNLDDFFFQSSHQYDDDIFVGDFGQHWTPPKKARLSKKVRKRINKLIGHLVAQPPEVFKDAKEVHDVVKPLVEAAVEFVRWCVTNEVSGYSGKARYYVKRLNGILKRLSISTLPPK